MTPKELIDFYGNEVKTAAALNVALSTVYSWKNKKIPHLVQLAAQTLTKGKLKADENS